MKLSNKNRGSSSKKPFDSQSGFNLIELMIGLSISIFILGGAITFLVTSSRTLVNQSSEDIIQENARFAFEILSSNVRLLGLNQSDIPNVRTEGIFDDAICNLGAGGANIDCNANALNYDLNGETIDYDSVAFDYVISNGTTCTGNAITQETKVVTVFFVADIDMDGIASLYCRSFESQFNLLTASFDNFTEPTNVVGGALANTNGALAIIDGIDSLQIQYGVDTNNDGDIERYSSYNNVSNADKANVKAIKVGLLVNSGQTIASDQNVVDNRERRYQIFDSRNDITDALLRQIYSTTIFFPNNIFPDNT